MKYVTLLQDEEYNARLKRLRTICAISIALSALLFISAGENCFAQQTFEIKSSSAAYNIEVKIDKCDEERKRMSPSVCEGSGRVGIYRKGSTVPFQVLNFKNLEVNEDQLAYNGEIDKHERKLYDDEYSFVFGDFNFDRNEDLAICTGRNGGYGAPSYSVYVYNVKSKQFVENLRLSKLAEGGYLGLFFIEPKKRQLVAHSKSGCCYHETEVYKVASNKPVLVERVIEEASGSDDAGYVVRITTRRLVKGKWVKRVRKKKVAPEAP